MLAMAVAVAATLLVGCGDKKKDKAATQTAAKVNKEEITVHQINFVLAQQRAIPPEQAASASRVVLERLIDQELALQKADDQKLDRDPRVVQQIEAARREIIARAYLEKIGEGAPKPTPAEVAAYYEAHPALFKERRVYSLQEVAIEAPPEQVEALKKTLASSKTFVEFVDYLKANNIRFAGNEAVRAAEQLPLASVDQFAKMKDGQAIFNVRPNGAQVIHLAASRTPAGQPRAGDAGDRAVPAQRAQAKAPRRRHAGPARRRQDRIRRRLRRRCRPVAVPAGIRPRAAAADDDAGHAAGLRRAGGAAGRRRADRQPWRRRCRRGSTLDKGLKGLK